MTSNKTITKKINEQVWLSIFNKDYIVTDKAKDRRKMLTTDGIDVSLIWIIMKVINILEI